MTAVTAHHVLSRDDIADDVLDRARRIGRVAWDIETSGLDWARDEIHTCQVALADEIAVIQLAPRSVPANLRSLLADPSVEKVFHHAPFDLRFMAHKWTVTPASVACTKIAAKIVRPGRAREEYSLRPLLGEFLGVQIDKGQQVSDWSREHLSMAQLDYAANDVRYLDELYEALLRVADRQGVADLVAASYAYLPTRVLLDLSGAGDVYQY